MKPSLRFLYMYCNDIASMRWFYSQLVQLDEIYFEEDVTVAYKCDELQFTIFQAEQKLATSVGWAKQPGWSGGALAKISWSIECDKETFFSTIARLKDAGVSCYHSEPQWQGYWSYPVLDPAGNTVEITYPG